MGQWGRSLANFVNPANVIIRKEFQFAGIIENNINQIAAQDGKIPAFALLNLLNDVTGDTTQAIQIYDTSSGKNIPVAIVTPTAGLDLLAGIFATGVIPSKSDITDPECRFFRVDY